MTLLDRFRRRPRWEQEDPAVRADGVREIPLADQDLLVGMARGDADPRVRRAAVKRVESASVLAALAREDSDTTVKEESVGRLVEIALGHDEAAAREATQVLEDARHLASIVRASGSATVRLLASSRIHDERTLATIAKTSEDAAVRREALARVLAAPLLADVATKSEHKDVATAAVDRIDDAVLLAGIEVRARNGGASRRARARLELLRPVPAAAEPPPVMFSEPEPVLETPPDAPVEVAPPAPAPPEAVPEAPAAPPVLEAAAPAHAPDDDAAAARALARDVHEKEQRARLARGEALLAKLDGLTTAGSLTLRDADLALREARDARAELDQLPARLAQRIKAARAALFAKTQPLREAEDWTRWSNAAIQEQLCERIEALLPREDFERVSRELHECDARWAEARHAPKEEAEALRHRYQAARSQVKARADAWFARKHESEAASLKEKEALCAKAEALAESTDWIKTADELKALQARWKEVGPVPHRVSEKVWKRFRTACDRFFTRRQDDLKQRKEEWGANLAKKLALCERAEALAASSEWDAAAAEVKQLQNEWKAVGPVKKSRAEEIWQRFRTACDAFFERYKRRDELAAGAKRAEREALCVELESLLPASPEAVAPDALSETVLALQARARHAPPLAPSEEQALARRFQETRNTLVAAWPEAFRGSELDPELARARKEKLVSRIEALAAQAEAAKDEGPLTGEALARRLKEALATNTMGGAAEAEARRKAEAEEVESARAAWKRLGHVPGAPGAALEARFEKACASFQAGHKPAPRRAQSRIGAGIG